jgi:hypothetical protein
MCVRRPGWRQRVPASPAVAGAPRPATLYAVKAVRSGAVVVACVVAACGGPDNSYVAESGSGLYLRLPAQWEVFPVEDGEPAVDPSRDPDFGVWSVLIDGAERPQRAHGEETSPSAPVGTVQVVPRELFESPPPLAHATLRSFFTPDGTDPLAGAELGDVEYDEIDLGHHWGNRLTATVNQDDGQVRVSQLAFFDNGGKRVHLVRIMCSLDCYHEHEDEIAGVLDSFTLEG